MTLYVQNLCVTGSGLMGSQIAMLAALAGIDTRLHDVSEEQLEAAVDDNRKHMLRWVAKGKLHADEMEAALARVTTTTDLAAAADGVDFVIEAVTERLEVKRQVFAELDRLTPERAILATNSSYLVSSQIADATGRPDKICNMHFFYPPLVMKLVEVVQGKATTQDTVESTMTLARRLDREPVLLKKELPGFLVNRVLRAIVDEAYYLLESGAATFEDIDTACRLGLNHPLGPFQLSDFSGLDIGYNARQEIYARTGRPEDAPPQALAVRVERGDLGRKTGRGFYDYSTTPPTPTED